MHEGPVAGVVPITMGRIAVQPGSLHETGQRVSSLGGGVEGLAGRVGSIGSGGGATTECGPALSAFSSGWSGGMGRIGSSVRGLGACAHAAGTLYSDTDVHNMPAGGA